MELFWEECRNILGKRIIWIWAAALTGAIGIYIFSASDVNTVIDGVRYYGAEAVQKDREIAAQWEGTLTMEKLYQILDTYGIAVDETAGRSSTRMGNWVSRYATDLLTDYPYRGSGALKSEQQLQELAKRLEIEKPYFTYMDGFEDILLAGSMFSGFGILLITIIGITPVFAEEYSLKTAALLLSSAHGRKKDVRMKAAASLALPGAAYLLANGVILLVFLAIYGSGGLLAGAGITMQIVGFSSFTCKEVWLMNLAWGLLGMLMMAGIALFFSAWCKTPFLALIWSLVCLFVPAILLNTAPFFRDSLPLYVLFTALGKWSPLYLPLTYGWGIGDCEMPWRLLFVLGVIGLSLFLGQRIYKRHEA